MLSWSEELKLQRTDYIFNIWLHGPSQSPDRQNKFNQLIVKNRITVQEEKFGQRKSKEN